MTGYTNSSMTHAGRLTMPDDQLDLEDPRWNDEQAALNEYDDEEDDDA